MSAAPGQDRGTVSIDDDLAWLNEQINALKELSRKGDVDEEECYDVSIRWGTALAGRLKRLVHYSSLGLLSDADERRYQALCQELRDMSDLIDRFGFTQPVFRNSPPASAKRFRVPRRAKSRRGLLRRGHAGTHSRAD